MVSLFRCSRLKLLLQGVLGSRLRWENALNRCGLLLCQTNVSHGTLLDASTPSSEARIQLGCI